jgi:hypothetical protein
MVTVAQHGAIDNALKAGFNVIVDDTNFFERGVKNIMKIAHKYGAEVEFKDFTDVLLAELIRRDAERRNGAKEKVQKFLEAIVADGNVPLLAGDIEKIVDSFGIPSGSNLSGAVGERVIRDMHKRYIQGRQLPLKTPDIGSYELVPYEPDESRPKAVIVDIDGTVAKMIDRSPYDWKRVGEDSPVQTVLDMVAALENAGHMILFTSGRDGSCYAETESWIQKHYFGNRWRLLMRAENDNRPDWIIKAEIFDKFYREGYNVRLVIDDRGQVVRMWRQLGLTVAQVAEGDF